MTELKIPELYFGPAVYGTLQDDLTDLRRKSIWQAFQPAALFAAADQGYVYDFTNKDLLQQDSAGTIPVTVSTNPIGRAMDISGKGNHATQGTAGSRPLWTGGVGVSDGTKSLAIPSINYGGASIMTVCFCVQYSNTGVGGSAWNHGTFNPGDAALWYSTAFGNLWDGWFIGAAGQKDAVQSRAISSANFMVLTAQFNMATGIATLRMNGEAYGSNSSGAPTATTIATKTAVLFASYLNGMVGKIGRGFVISRALTTSELYDVETWAALSGSVTIIPEIPPAGQSYYSHVQSYGQSLSSGVSATPIISTTTRFNDKMFTSGVHVNINGADYSTLIPLIESTATESASSEGETCLSGACEMIHERGSPFPFIAVCSGFPAVAIATLMQGQPKYNEFLLTVTNAWRRSKEANRQLKSRAFYWMQGESDGGNAAYAANMDTLRSTLNTDIKAITLQTENIWMLSYQLDSPFIGLAHLSASATYSNIRVCFPAYFLEHNADTVHLTNNSEKIAGAYFGLAYKAIIIDGQTSWQPLQIISSTVAGTSVDLVYNAVGALAFDTTINVSSQTNQGFRMFQSDGVTPVTINSVTLIGASTIRITCNVAIPVGAILRYGFADPTISTAAGIKGNVRDSQGNTIVFNGGGLNYPMHNWAVGQQRTIN
jgi:hypothetical protein